MTTTTGGSNNNENKSDDDGERWSKALPADMKEVIWNKLGLLESVRLGAVCSSWRVAAASNASAGRRPQFPWLAESSADAAVTSVDLGDEHVHQPREYRFPFKKQAEQIVNIVASGGGGVRFHSSNCLGSVDGWLIMAASWYTPQHPDTDIYFQTYPFFFNPISGRVHSTRLPPMQFLFPYTPSLKAVASSPPPLLPTSGSHDNNYTPAACARPCVVAVLDVVRGTVHFCRPTRPTQTSSCCWTPLDASNSSGLALMITRFLDVAMGEDAILYALLGRRDGSAPERVMAFDLFHLDGVKTILEVSAAPPKPIPAAENRNESDQSPFIAVGLKGEVFVIWHRYDLFLGSPSRTTGFAAFKLVMMSCCVSHQDDHQYAWEEVVCWSSSTSGDEEGEEQQQQPQQQGVAAVLFLSYKGAKIVHKSDLSAPIREFISRRAVGSCICFAMMSLRDIGVFPLAAASNLHTADSSSFSVEINVDAKKVRRQPVWFMAKPQLDQLCL